MYEWLDNAMCLFWPKAAFAKTVSFLLLPPGAYLFSRCLSVIYVDAGQSRWPFLVLVHWAWQMWAEAAVAQSSCPHLGLQPSEWPAQPLPLAAVYEQPFLKSVGVICIPQEETGPNLSKTTRGRSLNFLTLQADKHSREKWRCAHAPRLVQREHHSALPRSEPTVPSWSLPKNTKPKKKPHLPNNKPPQIRSSSFVFCKGRVSLTEDLYSSSRFLRFMTALWG